MKQYLLIFIFSLSSVMLSAQTSAEETLASIETQEQAKQFVKDKYAFNSKIFVFNEAKHKTQLAKRLFKLEKGQLTSEKDAYEKTLYKIIDKTIKSYHRVSYIFFDGNKQDLKSINGLRETLIKKYNSGIPFNELANHYSTDTNASKGGDTGWFTAGKINSDFEIAVMSDHHALNDIYSFDMPSQNAYYLVLKTFEPKKLTEIKVLKIVEPLD